MSKYLTIIDYFESLINEVDLKAEYLLAKFYMDNLRSSFINERRNSFINEIEQIKAHNLQYLNKRIERDNSPTTDDDWKILVDKYCFILGKYDMSFEQFDPIGNVDNDADAKTINETLGFLIVVQDGPFDEQNFSLFKEILFYGNRLNKHDEILRARCGKFHDKSRVSRIFNANFKDILVRRFSKIQYFKRISFNC